jgi:hypothetical protein
MFHALTRRRFAAALGIVAALAIAGFALAYFTSSGSGTGTASVGTDTPFVIHGSTSGTLYPGQSEAVTFTVDNNGGGNQKVGTVTLSTVAACSVAWSGTTCNGGSAGVGDVTGCSSVDPGNAADANASNFYMADVPVNHDYSPGTGQTVTPTGTLQMNDLSSSQNACKNAHLLLSFTAAAPSS